MKVEMDQDKMQCLLKYLSAEDLELLTKATQEAFNLSSPIIAQEWRGHLLTSPFSAKMAEYVYNQYEPTQKDVFIMSYPKTGTNWSAEVIRQIIFQNEEENMISKILPKPLVFLEVNLKEKFDILEKLPLQRKLMTSHLPASIVNVEKLKKANAKVVYVLRNPKDQLVSMYNFTRQFPAANTNEPFKSMLFSGWDKYFEHVVSGDFPAADKPGDWYPDHILSWYQHRDNKTVYFLYYEDMKKDLYKEIKKLAKFLEAPVTDEKAQSIAKACTFDTMKESKTKGSDIDAKMLAINMRKGQVGSWKDHLTVRQSEEIDRIFQEKMKETDIKFTYAI